MLNEAVSIYSTLVQNAVAAFRLHSIIGTGFVAAQSALVLLFLVEMVKGNRPAKLADPFEEAIPVRMRR